MFLLSFSIQPDATGAPGRQSTTQLAAPVGFCLIAHDYVSKHNELDREQKKHLKLKALSGNELVGKLRRGRLSGFATSALSMTSTRSHGTA